MLPVSKFLYVRASDPDGGTRDTNVYTGSGTPGVPTSNSGMCSYARGLVVRDTSLGRERDLIPSLCGVVSMRCSSICLSVRVCDHLYDRWLLSVCVVSLCRGRAPVEGLYSSFYSLRGE